MESSEARIIFEELVSRLRAIADPSIREPMAAYMRNRFSFFGVKTPERSAMLQEFIKDIGLPPMELVPELFELLWQAPERECQYLVNLLGQKYNKRSPAEWIPMYEDFITRKSWWDTVDFLAPQLLQPIFMRHPELGRSYTEAWNQSDNIWLVRASIIYQLKSKEKTDFEQMKRFILNHAATKEFFIQKAAGWALRQQAYIDPAGVQDFVHSNNLPPLTVREALKRL